MTVIAAYHTKRTGQPSRLFKDFTYRTRQSWSRARRVIGKAEHLAKGSPPRFVVTSLSADASDATSVFEREYCGRSDMENRIKEQQLFLFAERKSCQTLRANQLRLPIVNEIALTGKCIAFHCGVDAYERTHPFRIAKIARQFPPMPILIAHMGGVGFPDMSKP